MLNKMKQKQVDEQTCSTTTNKEKKKNVKREKWYS